MEDVIRIVTQASATLTVAAGAVTLILRLKTAKPLLPGEFRKIIYLSSIVVFIAVIGLGSMTVYHFLNATNHKVAEISEAAWYIFMFTAILLSCYVSYANILFYKRVVGNSGTPKNKKKK